MTRQAFLFLCLIQAASATLSVNTVWELRTTGTDTNGAAFVTGASGTDYSQNDNKNASGCTSCGSSTVNLSTTDAVAAGTTTITSATASFTSAIVGNVIRLSGGTGSLTAGWYQVTTFTNSTTIVVDRTVATGTGITMNIGGALLTWGQLFASTNFAAFHQAYVKSGTYTFTSAVTVTANCIGTITTAQSLCQINGYGTTRGDGGTRPLITTATNSTTLFNMNGADGFFWRHLSFSNTATTRSHGFNATGACSYVVFDDDVFDGFDQAILGNWNAAETFRRLIVSNTEIKNSQGGSNGGAIHNTDGATVINSYIHNGTGDGWSRPGNTGFTGPMIAINSVFANNARSGITVPAGAVGTAGYILDIEHCVLYNNTNDGLFTGDGGVPAIVRNNILANNGQYGWEASNANSNDPPYYAVAAANGYFSNTLGNYLLVSAAPGDIALTAGPFTSPGTGDFTLNSTAGGGAALKGVGVPGTTLNGTGHADIGLLQTQAAASIQHAYGTAQ